jgi:putative nucleotidyltransferase with HDIG domain
MVQRPLVQTAPPSSLSRPSSVPLVIQGAVVWRSDRRQRRKLATRHAGCLRDLEEVHYALQDTVTQVIAALVASMEMRDRHMYRHSLREAGYAVALAQALRLPERQVRDIQRGALLHDIGKLFVGPEILRERDQLTEDQFEAARKHAALGAHVISRVKELKEVAKIVRHHHERFDGGGYPDGLADDHIPLGARVVAIADAFGAMTEERPFRGMFTLEEALAELESGAGSQFDPKLVEVFVKLARGKTAQWPVAHDERPLAAPCLTGRSHQGFP